MGEKHGYVLVCWLFQFPFVRNILFYFVCLISSVCCFSAAQTVLIVYAHQSEGSFNAAVKDAAVDALKKQGCNVLVSDLYEMKFKATATKEDITGVWEKQCFVCLENNIKLTSALSELSGTNCTIFCFSGAVKNPEHFCYGNETMLAWQEGQLASEIVDEHKKLKEADLVIFQV